MLPMNTGSGFLNRHSKKLNKLIFNHFDIIVQ